MKEIKFRAWDKENKMFIELNLGSLAIYKIKHLRDFVTKTEVVQQFTGLLDKNGKEIYYGDIMLMEAHDGLPDIISEVVWEEYLGDGFRDKERTWQGTLSNNARKRKVIGNTYENKDLLK